MLTNVERLDRKKTSRQEWDRCRDKIMEHVECAVGEVLLAGGNVTQFSIEVPVHGVNPGQPILGVKRK